MWAAGEIDLSSVYPPTPLIERWNGKQWVVAYGSAPQHPNLRATEASLRAIIALDTRNVWTVGSSGEQVLVYHWDGQSWQQVIAPSFLYGSSFNAISAVSASDIWAVGSTGTRLDSITLVEHWDGKSWQAVPSPNPGTPAPPFGSA